jgi:hypothetical protein
VYWPQERWKRAAGVARRLAVLFGGPHTSEPSFRRATVQPGDLLYPIGVCDQVLYVFGRMRVQEIVPVGDQNQPSLDEYLARYGVWRFLAPLLACGRSRYGLSGSQRLGPSRRRRSRRGSSISRCPGRSFGTILTGSGIGIAVAITARALDREETAEVDLLHWYSWCHLCLKSSQMTTQSIYSAGIETIRNDLEFILVALECSC